MVWKKIKIKKGDQKPQRLDACTDYNLNLGKPRSKTNPHLMVKAELEFGSSRLLVREQRAKEDTRSRFLSREMILGKHHALKADVYLNSPINGRFGILKFVFLRTRLSFIYSPFLMVLILAGIILDNEPALTRFLKC